jgi:hypothetical protein
MGIEWITDKNVKELQEVLKELQIVQEELKLLAERKRWNDDDAYWRRTHKRQKELLAKWEEIQNRAK